MKFINRNEELSKLEEYYKLSKKRLFVVAISGMRRVGKTTLVKEFTKNKKELYFFVYDSKTSTELLREFSEELRKESIITEIESINSWNMFFEIIFKRCKNYVVVFDEFQNFYNIERSVFSILQKYCDEFKETPLNLIILGSLVGLFKKIFEDRKQPLYGRISAKISVKPFILKHSIEALRILQYKNFEEMLRIYGIFNGFPKYYATIEQFRLLNTNYLNVIEYLFMQENAPLETEVTDILRQEFGRRSPLYYSIIYAIATGKTKLNEISNALKMKESSITRHLRELEDEFNLIKLLRPIDNKKNARYYLNHSLIEFWFAFIYDKFSYYSIKDTNELISNIKNKFNTYFGRKFEEICEKFLIELKNQNKIHLDYLSKWWGFKRENDERKEIEIDIIGIDNKTKEILFGECKWKDKVEAEKILNELIEKAKYVRWYNDKRKESFVIFAKSFKKRIKKFENKKIYCFDLKDIEKILEK